MRIFPAPEALEDGWVVSPGEQGACDLINKRIRAPLGDTPTDERIRIHEVGHARYSKQKMVDRAIIENVDSAFQLCEDARIHLLLNRAGVDLSETTLKGIPLDMVAMASPAQRVGLLVGFAGTGDHEPVERFAYEGEREDAKRILGMITDDPESALVAARELRKLGLISPPATMSMRSTGVGRPVERPGSDSGDLWTDFGMDRDGKSDPSEYEGATPNWGKMSITVAPLTRPLSSDERGRRGKTFHEEGSIPRAMHRLLVDGAIFTRKIPRKGGTVLIDCSGSMSLTAEEVDGLLEERPALTVAIYGAGTHTGELRIIAREGMRAEGHNLNPPGGCNVIDGPALDWLCGQEGPRYWICDGYVTEVGDRVTTAAIADAARIQRQGRIKRFANMTAFFESEFGGGIESAGERLIADFDDDDGYDDDDDDYGDDDYCARCDSYGCRGC